MMRFLIAAAVLVHGGVHIGYLCSRSWPFQAGDPWLTAALGVPGEPLAMAASALVVVTFLAFLFAAATAAGLLPRGSWRPLATIGALASAIVLLVFLTPSTLPGLAIDGLLLWSAWSAADIPARVRPA